MPAGSRQRAGPVRGSRTCTRPRCTTIHARRRDARQGESLTAQLRTFAVIAAHPCRSAPCAHPHAVTASTSLARPNSAAEKQHTNLGAHRARSRAASAQAAWRRERNRSNAWLPGRRGRRNVICPLRGAASEATPLERRLSTKKAPIGEMSSPPMGLPGGEGACVACWGGGLG